MARQVLLRGNAPNDHPNAESLYSIHGKINDMTLDLYSLQSQIISAGDVRFASLPTTEAKISAARVQAKVELKTIVSIPAVMLPFDAYNVDFTEPMIRNVREGGDYSVYDVLAYGAYARADLGLSDTYSFVYAIAGAQNGGGMVAVPCRGQSGYGLGSAGAMSAGTVLQIAGGMTFQGVGGNQLVPMLKLLDGANRNILEVPSGLNQGARISNLRLEGNSANQSGTSHGLFCSNASPGSYMDTRTIFDNLFIHDFRTNGVITDANFGNSSWRDVIVRNCLDEGWLLNGTDAVFDNCQCNDAGVSGFKIQGWFNTLKACIAYRNGAYGFNITSSGKYTKLIGCDGDSSNFDNYKIGADSVTMKACSSRDPGRAADATYSHIDVASGLTGVNISGTTWKAKSLTNTAAYLIRTNGALTQSHIEATSFETNAATLGVALPGPLTNVTIVRPPGQQTLSNAGATPDISGNTKFVSPSVFALANSAPQTITNFINGQDGQQITLITVDGNTTIGNGASIQLQGGVNFAMANTNTLTLIRVSSVWREVGRHT